MMLEDQRQVEAKLFKRFLIMGMNYLILKA